MSMICNLRRVSRADAAKLLAEPEWVSNFLYEDDVVAPKPGFFSRLFGKAEPPPPAAKSNAWAERSEGDEVDIGKTWHGLQFLFTGTAWEGSEPACYLVKGGQEIGDVDVGYGPARVLMPDEIRRFGEFLQSRDRATLKRAYDPARMMEVEIYPTVWEGDDANLDEEFEFLFSGFEELRDFVTEVRTSDDAIIIYLN